MSSVPEDSVGWYCKPEERVLLTAFDWKACTSEIGVCASYGEVSSASGTGTLVAHAEFAMANANAASLYLNCLMECQLLVAILRPEYGWH